MAQRQKIKSNKVLQDCSKCDLPVKLLAEQKKLQSLAQNLFKIQEYERQQFSRELHDEIGQWLTTIYAEAVSISNNMPDQDTNILTHAQSIKEGVGKAHKVLHVFMHQLRPTLLDVLGLEDSLQDLKTNWCLHNPDISCRLELRGKLNNFGEMLNITIYRIIQEALSNISRYAKATKVLILLSQKLDDVPTDNKIILLEIMDNGKGFNSIKQSDGFGILGMRERTNALGGEFGVSSKLRKGTRINVRFPIESACAS